MITIEYLKENYPNTYRDFENSNYVTNNIYDIRYWLDECKIVIQITPYIPYQLIQNRRIHEQYFAFSVSHNDVPICFWQGGYKFRRDAEIASIDKAFELAENQIEYIKPKKLKGVL